MAKVDFDRLFKQFPEIKAGVIGDVMLDTYWWGHVERISPEAPVPVVALDKQEYRIGGAGNVALNLSSLGVPVSILSVIGDDENGKILTNLFEEKNIYAKHLVESSNRITTNKSRIISRNQQMMRLDSEVTTDLSTTDENSLLEKVEQFLGETKPQILIFEDYNKGVLTETLIIKAIALCKQFNVLTTVDPKRKNFFTYKGVDLFKPNLKEVKEGLNLLTDHIDVGSLENMHRQLRAKINHCVSFITLSEKGVFYQDNGKSRLIPSHLRNIADVSGAGDTVIAVASLLYAVTKDVSLMAEIANIAGGLVCEEVGTVAINKEKLLHECKALLETHPIPRPTPALPKGRE